MNARHYLYIVAGLMLLFAPCWLQLENGWGSALFASCTASAIFLFYFLYDTK